MRIKGLDFLRGIAILGVLFRHMEITTFLSSPGGYGVDLFFVLSGFLVSGLLFGSYRKNGNAGTGRFLIRRGFKIYPAFYFFIFGTVLIYGLGFNGFFPWQSVLSEVFFLQSYLRPMWSHTWSLAVEEHFYFLLALLVFLAVKYSCIEKSKIVVPVLLTLMLLPLVFRTWHVLVVNEGVVVPFYFTHMRIDGLFTGTLVGYAWHFKRNWIEKFYMHEKKLIVLAFILILPAFLLHPESIFMVTAGFNLLHAAFAILLLFATGTTGERILFGKLPARRISLVVCRIGVYSYSIYLWHLPVQNLLLRYVPDLRIESFLYFTGSVLAGIAFSKLIEKPFLKLRDRYFPAR